jgi:hypothetical protein
MRAAHDAEESRAKEEESRAEKDEPLLPTASHKQDPTPIVTQENPVGRVLLCYTGGTLGMVKDGGSWSPLQKRGGLSALISSMVEFHDDTMPDIHMVEYDPLLDSSNIGPRDWCSLANLVGRHYFDYDGFVIIHGTDTMAYTASALSFMLEVRRRDSVCRVRMSDRQRTAQSRGGTIDRAIDRSRVLCGYCHTTTHNSESRATTVAS